jgi:hypothetical protein
MPPGKKELTKMRAKRAPRLMLRKPKKKANRRRTRRSRLRQKLMGKKRRQPLQKRIAKILKKRQLMSL